MDVSPEFVVLASEFVKRNLSGMLEIGKGILGGANKEIQLRLKKTYSAYVASAGTRYGRSKSFFNRSEPANIHDFYIPLGVTCGDNKLESVSLAEIESVATRAVITGTAGSGKSMLLRHLFLDTLENDSRIPIFVELRSLSGQDGPVSLRDLIESSLSDHLFDLGSEYIGSALTRGHFVILLDGLDEIPRKLRRKLSREIMRLSLMAKGCMIVLSSRPDDSFSNWDEFSDLRVNPLTLDEACRLVTKLQYDEVVKDKFVDALRESLFDRHESFLSNPLLLSIMLLTYGQYADIPYKLSLFYDQAYEALFQRHDAQKGGFQRERLTKLDIQDFSKLFSTFCVRTYDQNQFQLTRAQCLSHIEKTKTQIDIDVPSGDFLDDCLQSVCLLIEDGMSIAFAHRSFQEYFVAKFIDEAAPKVQKELLKRFSYALGRDNIFVLLHEMNRTLVEKEFLLPYLHKMFEKIGVKRRVGITHFLRFLQNVFSEVRIDARNSPQAYIGFRSDHLHQTDELDLIQFSLRVYPTDSANVRRENPTRGGGDSWDEVAKKHGIEGEEVIVPTSRLTIKTPLLRDISELGGLLSLNGLQTVFERMKILEKKHKDEIKSLEALLS